MYEVVFSKRFEKDLRKLLKKNPRLKNKVRKSVELLIKDPKHKSLRLHKLSGTNNWSLTVTMKIRIIFSIRGKRVLCTRIGTHNEVY